MKRKGGASDMKRKGGVMAFSANLVNVKALASRTVDKNLAANEATANHTSVMADALIKFIPMMLR